MFEIVVASVERVIGLPTFPAPPPLYLGRIQISRLSHPRAAAAGAVAPSQVQVLPYELFAICESSLELAGSCHHPY